MPITGTAPRGQVGIMLETQGNGEIPLLASTSVIPSMTLTQQPSGTTGMRLHVRVYNQSTSGSMTITGTDIFASPLTETFNVPASVAQPTQSPIVADFEYVTIGSFASVTGITTTGLTNGILAIGGIQSAKYLLPVTFKPSQKIKKYSPNEYRGIIEKDSRIIAQTNEVAIDEISQDLYPDTSLWWAYMLLGAPTVTTLPAAPTSLKASAAITTSMSLTTQPTLPGMKLILAVTSFTTSVTLTINGTNQYGQTVSEIINVTGNGNYYSANVYSNVSGITASGTGASLGITGVYGWQLDFLSGGNIYSAVIEDYDGVQSMALPYCFLTGGDFEVEVEGQAKISSKGRAQDKLPIGDRTTSPLNVNRLQNLPQPTDLPISGWQGVCYLDPVTGTPGTTQNYDIGSFKLSLDTPVDPKYTFSGSYNYNRAYPGKRSATFELVLDFLNLTQQEQFRQNLKQYLVASFMGPYIGTSTAPHYKSWTWTLPFRYDEDFNPEGGPDKTSVDATVTGRCEYDPTLGYSYKLRVITQNPPVYNL